MKLWGSLPWIDQAVSKINMQIQICTALLIQMVFFQAFLLTIEQDENT